MILEVTPRLLITAERSFISHKLNLISNANSKLPKCSTESESMSNQNMIPIAHHT